MPAKKSRLSLTKSEIQAGVGAELLALCQSVTEDGTLTEDEILALRAWLETNRSSDLPAISFLATTVEQIIADGKVTSEEHKQLYKAIETVLPPEARKDAVEQRKTVEADERARAREERDAQKQVDREEHEAQKERDREERERKRPLQYCNFMVAGVHYEGRPEVIRQYVDDGDQVFLARDLGNRYSRNAIEVLLGNGMQIGFVPEDDAVHLAPLFDQGCPHSAYITKILTGGRVPIPVVQAYIYRADSDVGGLVYPANVPKKQMRLGGTSFLPRKLGCLTVVLFAILPVGFGFARVLRLLG